MASPGDDNGQASPLVVAWMTEYACTCKIPGLCEALMPSFTEVYTRQDQLDVACRDAVITSHLRLCLWTLNGGELDPESEETHSSILSLRPLVKENDIDDYVDLLFLCKAQILINCAEQERFNYSESNRILGNLIVEDEDSQTDDAYSNAVDDRVDQLKDDFRELFDMLHASRKKRKAASAGSTAAFLKSLKAKYSSEKFSKELSRFCSMWDSALSPCFLEKLAASGDPSAFGRSSGPSMEHLDAFLNTKLTAQELRGSLHSLSEQRWLNIHSRRDEEVVDFIRGGSRRTGAVRSRKSVRTSRRALDFDDEDDSPATPLLKRSRDPSDNGNKAKKMKGTAIDDNREMKANRRKVKRWSDDECKRLIQCVRLYGVGNWKAIKEHGIFEGRTVVDMKDKWRNLKKVYDEEMLLGNQ